MERQEFASILNLLDYLYSEELAEREEQVRSLRSSRKGMDALENFDQSMRDIRQCPHCGNEHDLQARSRLPKLPALSVSTTFPGRMRTHLQRKDGNAVRAHAQAGEVVPLSPSPVGRIPVPGRSAQVRRSRSFPTNALALAKCGPRSALRRRAEASERHRRGRRDVLPRELQGQSWLEARHSAGAEISA